MSNSTQSKVKYPVSEKAKEALLNGFRDVSVEDDGIFIYSRGFTLHHFLIKISKELQEIYIAEHATSIDYYTTSYLVKYEKGDQQTIGIEKDFFIHYNCIYEAFITDEVIDRIRQEVEKYRTHDTVYLEYVPSKGLYNFPVVKNDDIVEVAVVEKSSGKPLGITAYYERIQH